MRVKFQKGEMESKTSKAITGTQKYKPDKGVVKRHLRHFKSLGFEDQGSRPEMWMEQQKPTY